MTNTKCVHCDYDKNDTCIDCRLCFGMCGSCTNNDCECHPRMLEALCYADDF